MSGLLRFGRGWLLLLSLWLCAPAAAALPAPAPAAPSPAALQEPAGPVAQAAAAGATAEGAERAGRLSTALEIALLMTVLSLLPGALISITSFTRIVIVLSFVRRSLSTNELPPTPIILGLALFLTGFVMAPVVREVHAAAWVPYSDGRLAPDAALAAGWGELSGFLLANTRPEELALFAELATESGQEIDSDPERLPFTVVVPAFILSELKTAFQMGFLLFLPFLVIDLVVASVLLSMGMFMLPPVMVSTPFKVLLFVLVDGWHLICESLVRSFAVA